jgi:putative transposase
VSRLTGPPNPDPTPGLACSTHERRIRGEKTAYTEEQIAYVLRQAEAGTPVVEVCLKLGVSEQTFYRWKRRFAGTGVAGLRLVEDENRKLKQLVADLTLDKHMLQEVIRKKL